MLFSRLSLLSCWTFLRPATGTLIAQEPLGASQTPELIDFRRPDPGERLLMLHKKLVEIESITGSEGEIGIWLKDFFESHNWTVEAQEVAPKRYNILAYPKTVKDGKSKVLVTSHIDTVPPFIPYETRDDNTTIWGRGSVDAKASVAAQIAAAMKLVLSDEHDLSDDALALLYVVGEEVSGQGMKHFSRHKPHEYDAVIFGEPTESKLVCGHKGITGFIVHVEGKAAHSGYPWLGVSANNIIVKALTTLLALEKDLPRSDQFGNSTLNVGEIVGGVAANVVAETARSRIAIRLGGGNPSKVREMVEAALADIKKEAEKAGGTLKLEWNTKGYGPVNLECDVDGFDKLTVNYGTDVPNLEGSHRPYLFGPGSIFVAHGRNEHVLVKDLQDAVGAYEKLILHALGQ